MLAACQSVSDAKQKSRMRSGAERGDSAVGLAIKSVDDPDGRLLAVPTPFQALAS
jgi:hypothetical protein